ncbi:amino acid permease [Mycoplasmopsis mucosicanis]|uniref:Amino acid permease n=1 Tax=Mycoplasmopsis mucosicanis TaxID=458208 RepID=A0A507SXT9_9BACT|nr:amino acid permease [Mycoplasmopsis mucosicanis]TQC53948.1 amino acid permease [Mycoplasmopsis mucosicanis]
MQKQKKIGLFLSIAMIVGSVVGIGIFFKNQSVSKAVNGDGISWLLAWIIGGIISIAAAISFIEIGSFKNTKLIGLSNWVYKISKNKHLAYHCSVAYTLFYWGLLNAVIGIFASESLFFFFVLIKAVDAQSIKIWMHVIVGLLLSTVFIALNVFSLKASANFQIVITVVKFLPLLFALIIGIALPNIHNNEGKNAFFQHAFSLKGLIVALPAVLFSYDAFLVSSSISQKTKNPQKTLPKAILVGMILVVILYSLIALSSILHSKGVISDLINDVLPKKYSSSVSATIIFFVFASSLGVINGLSSAFISELKANVENNLLFGSKKLKEKIGLQGTFIMYLIFIEIFYFLIIIVPSIVFNTDIFVDGLSNFPTVFFFAIYGITILMYLIKRNKIEDSKKINSVLFYTSAIIAVVGITLLELSYLYFQFENLIINRTNNPSGWGVFWDNNQGALIKFYVPFVLYMVLFAYFMSIPWINYAFEKAIFKRDMIKDLDLNEANSHHNTVL